MAERRIILELGAGADLHGGDYTKAAKRAVEDAMRHSSLSLYRGLDLDPTKMRVEITIGAQRPDLVDRAAVADVLPYGTREVTVVHGGLDGGRDTVVVSAGVAAWYDLPEGAWRLAGPR